MTGADITAMSLMARCSSTADVVILPGGRCGPSTNQISRSAARASTIQMRRIRKP
jgi:hypothetical protein